MHYSKNPTFKSQMPQKVPSFHSFINGAKMCDSSLMALLLKCDCFLLW